MLTQKPWKDSLIYDRSDTNQPWTKVNLMSCREDDITIFNTNKSWILDAGATKCNPTDSQTLERGTWIFNTSETQLSYTRNIPTFVHTLDWKIIQLDEKIFIYEYFYHPSPVYYKVIAVH